MLLPPPPGRRLASYLLSASTCAALLGGGGGVALSQPSSPQPAVFATGLDNPRGLAFGPDGALYVAEAGTGGTESTAGLCPELQIGPPYGPYVNGPTARVSRIDANGVRTTLVSGLPSGQSLIPDWQGVASVAFVGERLFALVQGGGCSYGEAEIPKSVIEIDRASGTWTVLADLGAFRRANPPAVADDDLEPEGVFYAMVASGGRLYVLDANAGSLLEVSLDGHVRQVVDFTAAVGHITPTALAARGALYVGNLNEFPIVDGASKVYQVTPGHLKVVADGLTAVLGLAFDRENRLYVLETGNGAGSGFPDPEAGRILRIDQNGRRQVIADGLTFPTGMTFGPDGRLYVSNLGYEIPSDGTGEIVVIDVRRQPPP